jgi:hypothetical protein
MGVKQHHRDGETSADGRQVFDLSIMTRANEQAFSIHRKRSPKKRQRDHAKRMLYTGQPGCEGDIGFKRTCYARCELNVRSVRSVGRCGLQLVVTIRE